VFDEVETAYRRGDMFEKAVPRVAVLDSAKEYVHCGQYRKLMDRNVDATERCDLNIMPSQF
jgi:hypothetical protein